MTLASLVGQRLVDRGQHARDVVVQQRDPGAALERRCGDLGQVHRQRRAAAVGEATTACRRRSSRSPPAPPGSSRRRAGVRITLGRPRRADSNSSPWALGSTGNTSRAAPAMWPERMFSRSATSSTTMPREALMNIERGFIFANCGGAEEPGVAGPAVDVQRDDVGLLEQLVEGADPAGVAVGEPVGGVEEDHPEAERLGEVGELGADVAVADDAERAAADLVAALRRLVPDAGVHPLGLLRQPSRQRDDLADDELDHAAGVGVRRVEGRDRRAGPRPRGRSGWCRCRRRRSRAGRGCSGGPAR